MHYLSRKSEKTTELGQSLGRILKGGEIIVLEGDLGGGKTTFTKGVALGLGIKNEIISPTFTIERQYVSQSQKSKVKSQNLALHHFDFYRIDSPNDIVGLELKEVLSDKNSITVIEWGNKIEEILPKERLEIKFKYVNENTRKIIFEPKGERYKRLIEEFRI